MNSDYCYPIEMILHVVRRHLAINVGNSFQNFRIFKIIRILMDRIKFDINNYHCKIITSMQTKQNKIFNPNKFSRLMFLWSFSTQLNSKIDC